MTRVFDKPQEGGGTRLLVLGASAYADAQVASLRVPKLNAISSAATSAMEFAFRAIDQWEHQFVKPLASVDLLVDTPAAPDGATFVAPGGAAMKLDAPTMANVKAARRAWMAGAGADDVLIFYCCGHGIWLPASGKTFLTSSFGSDPDNPWPDAIALEDFAFGLAEHAPRRQWLIFDCCNNTPTEALKAMSARADALLASTEGQRQAVEAAHGRLSQVTLASSSPGAQSFGRAGRPSRFMEAFLEACDGAGSRLPANGKWWVDQQGLEDAIATYKFRVAAIEEEDYFTFSRVTQTDAADIPVFLGKDEMPTCTLLVRSDPPHLLKQAALSIRCRPTANVVGSQAAGPQALARYRISVQPWLDYDLEATFDSGPSLKEAFAMPPFAETIF